MIGLRNGVGFVDFLFRGIKRGRYYFVYYLTIYFRWVWVINC